MAESDDATSRLDELETLAREYGVIPAFRWPDRDEEEVEACYLRLRWDGAKGDGLMVLEVGAVDGSWADDYLVGARHFVAAARGAAVLEGSDEPFGSGPSS
ncbi:MAG TPA: hypothetical protein VKG89_03405 [Solirubrobacterales bacterium]|nr:hypothetical protein [Solirubrobacterales bacterium]